MPAAIAAMAQGVGDGLALRFVLYLTAVTSALHHGVIFLTDCKMQKIDGI